MQQFHDLYIGTYTQPILFGTGEILQGKGHGIYHVRMDRSTGKLSQPVLMYETPNPSYLSLDSTQSYLYAVNELKEYNGQTGGSVSAFSVNKDGSLKYLNTQPTFGTDPCHVAVSPDGSYVVVSNFMSGSVSVYPCCDDGSLANSSQTIQHQGKSINSHRQSGPHAHSAVFDHTGNFILVPDLGADKVFVYKIDKKEYKLYPVFEFKTVPGSGPRYCEFHPDMNICYLINELSSSISLLRFDPVTGKLAHIQTISTLPDTYNGNNICADLHVRSDGRFLYGSNRGHDSIVVYSLNPNGEMKHVQTISSGGRTPRNFSLTPNNNFLIAANQDSDNLVVFIIDSLTGMLTKVDEQYVPTPVCIRAIR